MNRIQVLRKIEGLLRLSGSENIHEAALAAERVRELIAHFQIEQHELGLSPASSDISDLTFANTVFGARETMTRSP